MSTDMRFLNYLHSKEIDKIKIGKQPEIVTTKGGRLSIYDDFMVLDNPNNGEITIWEDNFTRFDKNDGFFNIFKRKKKASDHIYERMITLTKDNKIIDKKLDEYNPKNGTKTWQQKEIAALKQQEINCLKLEKEQKKIEEQLKAYANFETKVINDKSKGYHCSTRKNGVIYDEIFTDSQISITNKQTHKTDIIDLNEKLIGMAPKQKQLMIDKLKECSGDVLMDIAQEVSCISPLDESDTKVNGRFFWFTNEVKLEMKDDPLTKMWIRIVLAHETGHALYGTADSNDEFYKNFESVFNQELKAYKNKDKTGAAKNPYATTCRWEMFAESYAALTTGNCSCTDTKILVKYFPKTLSLVEDRIKYIRSLSTEKRRSFCAEVGPSEQKKNGIGAMIQILNVIIDIFGTSGLS